MTRYRHHNNLLPLLNKRYSMKFNSSLSLLSLVDNLGLQPLKLLLPLCPTTLNNSKTQLTTSFHTICPLPTCHTYPYHYFWRDFDFDFVSLRRPADGKGSAGECEIVWNIPANASKNPHVPSERICPYCRRYFPATAKIAARSE